MLQCRHNLTANCQYAKFFVYPTNVGPVYAMLGKVRCCAFAHIQLRAG